MRGSTATNRLSRGVAWASDDLIDFLVLAFAAWTIAYHVCLVLGLRAVWAAVLTTAAFVPAGFAVRRIRREPRGASEIEAFGRRGRRATVFLAVNVAAAFAAATLFAFGLAPWAAVWLLWVLAAGAAVVLTSSRRLGLVTAERKAETAVRVAGDDPVAWPGAVVALLWAVGLATLSLFLVDHDSDDAYYVHLSSWVADRGKFPVRDTMFSDQGFPAIIFPPTSSFEGLLGTVARGTGLAAPDVVYLVATPLASGLTALAAWRLLRTWGVPLVGVALSVAIVFLLLDGLGHRTYGSLFIGRIWQGKIVFLAVLVPILFALLHEFVQRPTRRQLLLLAAAGVAGVGLTSSSVFLIPLIAFACLVSLAFRATAEAAAGFAATAAYPLIAGVATATVGPRNADVSKESDVVVPLLVEFIFREGPLALIAVIAVLIGPVLIRRAVAAQMTATTVLLVALLFAPGLPLLVFHLTGLGQVLWRLHWAVPAAALVGVLAAGLGSRIRVAALRPLPAVLLCAIFVVWGTPIWSAAAGTTVAAAPAWKRPADQIAAARRVLAHTRSGDAVLAPLGISQTILVMSGSVTAVAPRTFYTRALRSVPRAHASARLRLLRFAEHGLGPLAGSDRVVKAPEIARALRKVRVDIACVWTKEHAAQRLLVSAGFERAVSTRNLSCLRRGPP